MFAKFVWIVLTVTVLLPVIQSRDFGIYSNVSDPTDEECANDINKIVEGVTNGEIWALKILDASTKIPPGILTGHLFEYGNFDECLDDPENVTTQFCTATLGLDLNSTGLAGNDSRMNPAMGLRWSYCIPLSCSPKFLQDTLQKTIEGLNIKINVSVYPWDCEQSKSRTITTGDYVGISIWLVFIALALLSTIYDVTVKMTDGTLNPWLASFSLYTNGKSLMKTEVTEETMAPLYGIRFLSICWVILGHRYFFTAGSPLLNLVAFGKELEMVRSQLFIQGLLAVDTFFLLSGFLNCYFLMKVLEKTNRFPVLTYYIHRYIRLTPALAAIVLMYATWFYLLGNGPAWNFTISIWRDFCVDNWWPTLLYINNYYNPLTQCAGQSWYLAVDMQLYWLSPLVVLPLWKWPRIAKYYLGCLLAVSVIISFVIAYVNSFRLGFSFGFDMTEMENVMKMIYMPTHARATPYIIGLMLGYYLHHLRKTKTRLVFSKCFTLLGWCATTLVCLSVIFGNYQFTRPIDTHPYNRWESSLYISLHRLAWGAGISWIILACLNRSGGIINSILSWRVFMPLGRLTYSIFLCHMAFQQYLTGIARTSDYFDYFNQIHRYFGDLVFGIMGAVALTLLFESPILVLEKLILKRPAEKKQLKSEVNEGFQSDSSVANKSHEI